MNVFEILILNSIYLIFPLGIYLLYQIYGKTLSKEKNELYLDIALISSFYLITQYGISHENCISLLLLNIPLVIAYVKNRKLSIVFLSIMMIINYHQHLGFPIIFLMIEYISYFLIYLLLVKKDMKKAEYLYILLFVKCICFMIEFSYFISFEYEKVIGIVVGIVIFYAETIAILCLFKKTEDILKLYKTIQELQEEKQVRESLFKITHEIKNPIAVCKGYLDMFDASNPEHGRKYIPIIKSEIERVLILLKDFLSITKIKVELDIIDINMLVEDVIDSFLPLINDRKIEIISDDSDDELYILADYNRLSQVFINLIKNSIEALEGIDDAKITVSIIENKSNIIIKVKDNGSGISPENIRRMNEPFFTTKRNGTGLGVYLSTEIIKAHGGSIRYESSENGTTAIVTLPNKKGY